MLEMVITVPVMLLLLFGIAELGILLSRWQTLSNAVREGARLGVVFRDPATCNAAIVESSVQTTVADYADAVGMTLSTIDVIGECDASGTPLTVTGTFPYTFQVLPNIQLLFGSGSLASSFDLQVSSTMRNE